MIHVAEPVRLRPQGTSWARLLLLGSVSLLPPIVLLVAALSNELHDIEVNAIASGVIFVLVTLRLGDLVHVARQSTQRESVLRRTGESLVSASSREEIYAVSAKAIKAMLGAPHLHRVIVAVGADNMPTLVHDSEPIDDPLPADSPLTFGDLFECGGVELPERYFVTTNTDLAGESLRSLLGSGVPVLVAALPRSGAVAGVVVVSGVEVEHTDIIDAICALAAQMALALESADLTEQVLQRKNEAQFRSLIQNTSDIILVVNHDLDVDYVTPSLRAVLGHDPSDMVGAPLLELLSPLDVPRAASLLRRARSTPLPSQTSARGPDDEWRLQDALGAERAFEVTCSNLLDDPLVRGFVLTLHDTTERRALEEKLKHMAFHDALTQLPNRTLFLDRVEHALSRQGRHRERLAVMLIDLDDFKIVNDTRGHAAGDALLVAVTNRLREAVRPEDTCARLGGDEFAVLVEGLASDDEAEQLAERILTVLKQPFELGDEELVVHASIGLSTSDYGEDAAELLVQADLAMYAAKDAGKGAQELYRPSLQAVMQSRLSKARDLQRALSEGQFVLHYQPIVHLSSGNVVGTEALVRWQHPQRGLLLPGEFIDAVEEGDLAVPLGEWVLTTAIAQAAAWQRSPSAGGAVHMSVNIAPRQLSDPGFIGIVIKALEEHGLAPGSLVLEITERTLTVQAPQVVWAMEQLQRLGVGLAIDDFGTGYAALAYLRRFPVTTLKIDRSFVKGVDTLAHDHALVEAVIRLGETFRLDLVAEGIETSDQRDALIALGCERGQGFLYARALPSDKAAAYITDHSNRAANLDYKHPSLSHYAQGASLS
jgi:diguanylate cyclase (GGDEF)-like protein/PAS domain S-box-containing protein